MHRAATTHQRGMLQRALGQKSALSIAATRGPPSSWERRNVLAAAMNGASERGDRPLPQGRSGSGSLFSTLYLSTSQEINLGIALKVLLALAIALLLALASVVTLAMDMLEDGDFQDDPESRIACNAHASETNRRAT